jgi:hypothetical protein
VPALIASNAAFKVLYNVGGVTPAVAVTLTCAFDRTDKNRVLKIKKKEKWNRPWIVFSFMTKKFLEVMGNVIL